MNGKEDKRWYLWARVSTVDQYTDNQLAVLRAWPEQIGGRIVREFIIEDSAWAKGQRVKGQEFERQRFEMLNGLRRGDADGVLIWDIDRLSRRGPEDMLQYLRLLAEVGTDIRSREQSWLNTIDPYAQMMLVSMLATLALQSSDHKSKNIKLGMARAKREIAAEVAAGKEPSKKIGGRKTGSKDKRKRATDGYKAAWGPGGKLRVARDAQLAAKRAEQVAQVSAIVSEAAESAAQDNSTGSEEQ